MTWFAKGCLPMNAVKAIWKNGQVVLSGSANWPEGRKLIVAEESPPVIEFMTEAQQSDDPEAIQRWIDEVAAIPPLPMTPEQELEMLTWRQKAKEFNLEAVRRQMAEDNPSRSANCLTRDPRLISCFAGGEWTCALKRRGAQEPRLASVCRSSLRSLRGWKRVPAAKPRGSLCTGNSVN
jgi:hypothetical protein